MPTRINPKKAVESAAPALNTSQYHTRSNALHKIYFAGNLQPWPGFLNAVQGCHEDHTWQQRTLGYTLQARDSYTHGNVEVGDEHGVQGRFQKFFGDVFDAIFASQSITTRQNINIRFADFKCIPSTYSGTPDVIVKDSNHALKIVGELRAPWIIEHRIRLDDDQRFRAENVHDQTLANRTRSFCDLQSHQRVVLPNLFLKPNGAVIDRNHRNSSIAEDLRTLDPGTDQSAAKD